MTYAEEERAKEVALLTKIGHLDQQIRATESLLKTLRAKREALGRPELSNG